MVLMKLLVNIFFFQFKPNMTYQFELNTISRYSQEITGIAAIMIILSHAVLSCLVCGQALPSFMPAWLIVTPILAIMCMFLKLNIRIINKIFHFMGRISLESYLTNITLPIVIYWFLETTGLLRYNGGNYLLYSLSVLCGIVLSVVVNHISKRIVLYGKN